MVDDNKPKEVKPTGNEYCKIQPTIVATNRYDIYLNHYIDKPDKYFEMLEILRSAGEEDEIYLHINNNGGYVDTSAQIINAMADCKATITTCLEGAAHSCASMILIQGDEIKICEHGNMLCHYYSGGLGGKGQEIEAQSEFDKKWFKGFFRKIYKGFLEKAEIERLIKGEDFWLSSENIKKRLLNMKKHKSKDL